MTGDGFVTGGVRLRRFAQVDVFTALPLRGNPLAVVHDADGLDDDRLRAFARWTNLSETTFLLPPTDPLADYRVRIFTPDRELPFAGHPTLGSCHAWLAAGGVPRDPARIVQQCGVGRVPIRRHQGRLWFAAPPLRRSGPAEAAVVAQAARALRLDAAAIVETQWVANGPSWLALRLGTRDEVLALRPDFGAFGDLEIGVVGPWPQETETGRAGDAPADEDAGAPLFEVRGFVPTHGVNEDAVTGSLNAGLAQWMIAAGLAPRSYVVSQGTALGRAGRVHVLADDEAVWIGGDVAECIRGEVRL